MPMKTSNVIFVSSLLVSLIGCSGSGGQSTATESTIADNSADSTSASNNNSPASDLLGDIPDGDITLYGAITVGDDAGMASDLVAAFFELEKGVSGEFLESAFSSNKTLCTVDDDDKLDFEEISAGFIPSFNGVSKKGISAGETITITSDEGTFANMQIQSVGAFLFYTLPDMQALPSGPVPQFLQADFAGDVFPGYQAMLLPSVEMLATVEFTGGAAITPTTVFSWTPATEPGSMVRIFTSTNGGFFLEDGKTVTCLVPDTGTFVFPASVQTKLGAEFTGGLPIFSRVGVSTETVENATLFLIRESFTNE